MEEINHHGLSYAWHHDEFCQALAAQLALIHCRQILAENRIAIRFENGYGVTILRSRWKKKSLRRWFSGSMGRETMIIKSRNTLLFPNLTAAILTKLLTCASK